MEPRENAVSDTRDPSWDSKAGTGRVDFGTTTGPPHRAWCSMVFAATACGDRSKPIQQQLLRTCDVFERYDLNEIARSTLT